MLAKIKRPIILIVEDEVPLLEMYKMKFNSSGFEVYGASNGEAGLMLAKNHIPGLILLDILMPKVDGYEMLKELKSDKNTKNIPVIVFSNLSQKDEVQKGFNLGADDYIIKTELTPSDLVKKVNTFIKKINNKK